MRNPAQDTVDHLAGAGLGLTKGTDLFASMPRAQTNNIPANSVFVYGLPGGAPTRAMGEVEEILVPVVMVVVRHRSYSTGDALGRSIRDSMQAADISPYLDVVAQSSELEPIGQDNDGNHQFMLGFELSYVEAA